MTSSLIPTGRKLTRRFTGMLSSLPRGRAQLSLVEHALCPLDLGPQSREPFVHETTYTYYSNGHPKTADVRVTCPQGLNPADEFVLWGLLSLTFGQAEPSPELHATPHYCLKHLGIIADKQHSGGKQYQLFRESVRRLGTVVYQNTGFYDPLRGEHRDTAFGFLSYSLPIDPTSSRAWRFVWNPLFFEICDAAGGSLMFDLATYRRLDFASRRLFVLLQKVFHRRDTSPTWDVRDLCVQTLGFAETIEVRNLKIKLARCIETLVEAEIVRLPDGMSQPQDLFRKLGVGEYAVTLLRGAYFDRRPQTSTLSAMDSPLVDPLRGIGFDAAAIERILKRFKPNLIREWADITLAAREHNGDEFFRKSAAAYFMDNIQHAVAGRRTPPDWWREMRMEEMRRQREAERADAATYSPASEEAAFRQYLETEARDAFDRVTGQLIADFTKAGRSESDARESAEYMARIHLLNRFRREKGSEWNRPGLQKLTLDDLRRASRR